MRRTVEGILLVHVRPPVVKMLPPPGADLIESTLTESSPCRTTATRTS